MYENREQEKILLEIAVNELEKAKTLNPDGLRDAVEKRKKEGKIDKNITLPPADNSVRHKIDVARILLRIKELIQEDYDEIIDYVSLLTNKAGDINRLNNDKFIEVIKELVVRLPMTRYEIDKFIELKLEQFDTNDFLRPGKYEEHDFLKKEVGIPYLKDMGCGGTSVEVYITKNLKIDVLGWKDDGAIVGIEVKRTISDFNKATKKSSTMVDYARCCNEFYILTDNKKVYDSAEKWAKEIEHTERKNVGVLLYDRDMNDFKEKYEPSEVKKEVCKETLIRARLMLLRKISNTIKMVRVNEEDDVPEQVIRKVMEALEREFNTSNLMKK